MTEQAHVAHHGRSEIENGCRTLAYAAVRPLNPTSVLSPVRHAVEAVGARLLFLPPYSPDFNPIENASPSSRRSSLTGRGAEPWR